MAAAFAASIQASKSGSRVLANSVPIGPDPPRQVFAPPSQVSQRLK
jgi:hypothetical protein